MKSLHAPTLPYGAQTLALWALIVLTLREAWGQRLAALATGLATLGLALAVSLSGVSIFAHTRLVVDVALTLSTLFIVATTVAQGQRLVHQDLAMDAPSVLMARALPVGLWLWGRFLGLWLTTWGLAGLMGATTWAGMRLLGFEPPWALAQAFALIPCEAAVLLACGMVFAGLVQPRVAALAILAWAAAGYMAHDIVAAWGLGAEGLRAQAVTAAHAALPELERLHGRLATAHAHNAVQGYQAAAWAYACMYAGVWLFFGAIALRRRRSLSA